MSYRRKLPEGLVIYCFTPFSSDYDSASLDSIWNHTRELYLLRAKQLQAFMDC